MEDSEQSNTIPATFPRPPPFHEHFTTQNIARIQEIRTEAGLSDPSPSAPLWQSDPTKLSALPPELRFLIPPIPPSSGKYRSFGEQRDINETLPVLPQGIEQLYPAQTQPSDRAHHLLNISRSLLLNFLELIGALAANPEAAHPKIDDLRTLFFNAHQLVNEYRPHQARETLISMMERRLEQKRSQVEDVKAMRLKVSKLLTELGDAKPAGGAELVDEREEEQESGKGVERRENEQRRVWRALNAIET